MAYGSNSGGKKTVGPISEWKLKEQMCDIGRRIWVKGFCAGNEGNHSYRIGPNRVLCTPTGVSKANLRPEDMCVVDMQGKQVGGSKTRTSEIMLHLAIYQARADVKAVVHSHPPHATAFAVAGLDLPSCIHPEAEVFLGVVPTAKYVTPGDKRLGESILPFVKDSNTILMGSHGVVCFAENLEQAYYRLEIVDAYARILLLAKGLGSVKALTGEEMKELLLLKGKFGQPDARVTAGLDKLSCAGSDFMSRVGGDIATRGRMMRGDGAGPAPTALDQAVAALTPSQYGEEDIEQLVQVITDQIMGQLVVGS